MGLGRVKTFLRTERISIAAAIVLVAADAHGGVALLALVPEYTVKQMAEP